MDLFGLTEAENKSLEFKVYEGVIVFNFETELVKSISKRCTDLRRNSGFRQDEIADKSSISKIENMKYNEGDNFITHTVLEACEITFNISKDEIIFGSESEFEEFLLGFSYS